MGEASGRLVRDDAAVRLVPKRLRKSTFPSRVPYYGGRLTPEHIAGLEPRHPPAAPVSADHDRTRLLAALGELHAAGVVTEPEHTEIAKRILADP
jgi:hypothetical protein